MKFCKKQCNLTSRPRLKSGRVRLMTTDSYWTLSTSISVDILYVNTILSYTASKNKSSFFSEYLNCTNSIRSVDSQESN